MNKLQFKILNTVRLVLTRISSDVNLIAAFVVNNKRFAPHFRCDKVSEKGTNNQNRSSPVKNISKIIKSENSIAVKVDLTTKGKKKVSIFAVEKISLCEIRQNKRCKFKLIFRCCEFALQMLYIFIAFFSDAKTFFLVDLTPSWYLWERSSKIDDIATFDFVSVCKINMCEWFLIRKKHNFPKQIWSEIQADRSLEKKYSNEKLHAHTIF